MTARPSFTFGIQLLEGVLATIDAGFELDLPKLYAKATAVTSQSFLRYQLTMIHH